MRGVALLWLYTVALLYLVVAKVCAVQYRKRDESLRGAVKTVPASKMRVSSTTISNRYRYLVRVKRDIYLSRKEYAPDHGREGEHTGTEKHPSSMSRREFRIKHTAGDLSDMSSE